MAASLLSAVEPIIKGKAFEDLCKASFPVSGLISVETARVALQSAKELLSNDGIPLSSLKKSELNGFIKDAPTAEAGSFTLAEYQALLETVTKYAALKACHNNGKRWGLGLSLSTAGAMALTAAVFTSASMMLVAVPAGAAVGAVAVAADGSRGRRRDRRTAKQGSSSSSKTPAAAPSKAAAPAEEPAPAADVAVEAAPVPLMVEDSTLDIAPAGADEEAVVMASPTAAAAAPATAAALEELVKESPTAAVAAPAAAAAAAAVAAVAVAPPAVPAPAAPTPAPVGSGNSSPRGSSEELVSAVVDFMPAAEPAAADSKPASHPTVDVDSGAATGSADDDSASLADVPAPVQCDSPFSAAARDTTAAPAFASSELPADALLMPPAVRTSTGSDLPSSTSAAAVPSAPAASAGLPPKPKKSKSLTKSMSKKIKKAFSLKDKDTVSSSSADAGAHRALDADSADGSPLAPPVPPVRKSGSFFRRSSDGGSFLRRSTDGSGSGGSSFFRRSSSDMGVADADSIDGSVERSKGSATIKKMVDGIRRSFSLERPSLELLAPKRARKDKAAAAAL